MTVSKADQVMIGVAGNMVLRRVQLPVGAPILIGYIMDYSVEQINAVGDMVIASMKKFLDNKESFSQDTFDTFMSKITEARIAMRNNSDYEDSEIAMRCKAVVDYVNSLYN